MSTGHAFVKDRHGFIGRSELYLQKVSFLKVTMRTNGHRSIDIFPRRRPAQNIMIGGGIACCPQFALHGVHDLYLVRRLNRLIIGTGHTIKLLLMARARFRRDTTNTAAPHLEQRTIQRTEPHGGNKAQEIGEDARFDR
jgi:hypothetical protein